MHVSKLLKFYRHNKICCATDRARLPSCTTKCVRVWWGFIGSHIYFVSIQEILSSASYQHRCPSAHPTFPFSVPRLSSIPWRLFVYQPFAWLASGVLQLSSPSIDPTGADRWPPESLKAIGSSNLQTQSVWKFIFRRETRSRTRDVLH